MSVDHLPRLRTPLNWPLKVVEVGEILYEHDPHSNSVCRDVVYVAGVDEQNNLLFNDKAFSDGATEVIGKPIFIYKRHHENEINVDAPLFGYKPLRSLEEQSVGSGPSTSSDSDK